MWGEQAQLILPCGPPCTPRTAVFKPLQAAVVWPVLGVIHTLGEELENRRDTAVTGKQPRTQIDMYEMTNARLHTCTRVRCPPRADTGVEEAARPAFPPFTWEMAYPLWARTFGFRPAGREGRGEGRTAPAPLLTG